ncbi:hypothetical protein ABB37_05675 [Leptomonas pyrrhocoris]|uniref:F-box domain-containing protein n=1 Tax=Leptomonas pyrrhocoris TaxID=157538 RepID=A0A0M9FZ91_LEPPY|nr:hypothetical protein ABB37_05675 [Leptomonas pyrrhocoris]XP_015657619.1 hypothetical protein ABB37_05675 [Leptomonas pyrrhocoris]KPA79179.1 hypothetical protein ABB37_05675 [Leptomonas pyrrhocoris]KPA79180.1 hypothetical protein ABB37_05675 [Leptomonas pyrrhocoris]|eukprot:XP_015657618.1 hypothetical protein ABB37_05675 [Leptomonas pyrrhocoris]
MASFLSVAPDNVLDSIFIFCDYGELFASSHVCTSWRRRTGNSIMWRRVAQEDLDRARGTEYQIVATPVQKRAGLSSSFNVAHLYTVEVRTRRCQREQHESAAYGDGAGRHGGGYASHGYSNSSNSSGARTVPSYAQNLQMYSFGGGSTSAIAASVERVYGGGGGGGELERNPSSTCFATLGSTAKVRRVCMRYLQPLRFTAGDAVAAALLRASRNAAHAVASSVAEDSHDDAAEGEKALPLWEDGSILRRGVLLCDPHDPCTFCYYAATLRRPWCTVLMDRFVVDDALLVDFITHNRDGDGGGNSEAATCIDLAFRVEELPVVRNDPRDPSHLVKPAQPVGIRIGVIEESQLDAYRRGLQQVVSSMAFYSLSDAQNADDESATSASKDSDDFYGNDHRANPTHNTTASQDYAWGALDAGPTGRGIAGGGGVSWSYTARGGHTLSDDVDDPNSAAAAEAEVAAWLQASVREATQASPDHSGAAKTSYSPSASSKPLEFWAQAPDTRAPTSTRAPTAAPYTSHSSAAHKRSAVSAAVSNDDDGGAFVLGDTPGSFGYDTEGGYISEASSYPLGAPLQKGDVVHLQFFHDEDVIVVTRNRERLGTLVADAFSERQRWCVAVSLQNCGVRFIPPRLN